MARRPDHGFAVPFGPGWRGIVPGGAGLLEPACAEVGCRVRLLPGPVWLRILLLLVLATALVFALFTWVFPWVDGVLNPINVTVE